MSISLSNLKPLLKVRVLIIPATMLVYGVFFLIVGKVLESNASYVISGMYFVMLLSWLLVLLYAGEEF